MFRRQRSGGSHFEARHIVRETLSRKKKITKKGLAEWWSGSGVGPEFKPCKKKIETTPKQGCGHGSTGRVLA
jgi:hypothetical protein